LREENFSLEHGNVKLSGEVLELKKKYPYFKRGVKEVLEAKGKAGKDDADRSEDEASITPPRLQVRLPDKYNVGGGTLSCRASGAPPDSKKTGIVVVHTAHESPPSLVPVIDTERQSKELYFFPPQTAISEHLSAEQNFTPTFTNPRLEPVSSPLSLCNERKDA
jgi:hypothetical protein